MLLCSLDQHWHICAGRACPFFELTKHVEQLDDVVADMTGSTYEVRKEAETIILRAWHSCGAIYVPFAP